MGGQVLLLSCEHGGNRVPAPYRHLFSRAARTLQTHRGLDIGALEAARYLRRRFRAPLISATVTRLLVDLNRSIGHPTLFSEFTRVLSPAERRHLLDHHYLPYRSQVAGWIGTQLAGGRRVVHIAVHSFTPVLHGKRRRADIGLLYDPACERERVFCRQWQQRIAAGGDWQVRCNYPYRGTADGLIPVLRRQFGTTRYLGIEIELNQAHLQDVSARAVLLHDLAAALPWRSRQTRPVRS